MGRDIPLGRIFGVKVGMDVSVVLIAVIYTVILATNRLPIESPGHGDGVYWVAGALGALLFFLSLLVHEIGHALVARDEGIGVQGISLWLLGGVARLESSPSTPRSEFRIAVVGPLASAATGAALLVAAYLLPDGGLAGLLGNLLGWLGVLNLILAAFNMLPASPLDGGTVLSALVWWRTGSQATGMRWAARAGLAAGAAMVLWGLRDLRSDDGGQFGIWVLAVGGFIAFNAARSLRAAPLYELLDGTRVADAMVPRPPVALATVTVADFLRHRPHDATHRAYPVAGPDGRIAGLLTASAVQAAPPHVWEQLTVGQLAFPLERIAHVRDDEPLLPALQKLHGSEIDDGLVVGRDGTVVGTIDATAVYRLVERRQAELAAGAT